jgi:hypothetical protein
MGDDRPAPQPRPAGIMVAVHAGKPEDEELAIGLLRDRNARMIERAEGTWREGKWFDFDPVRAPDIVESHVTGRAGDTAGRGP